jgi:hypothetical protein
MLMIILDYQRPASQPRRGRIALLIGLTVLATVAHVVFCCILDNRLFMVANGPLYLGQDYSWVNLAWLPGDAGMHYWPITRATGTPAVDNVMPPSQQPGDGGKRKRE